MHTKTRELLVRIRDAAAGRDFDTLAWIRATTTTMVLLHEFPVVDDTLGRTYAELVHDVLREEWGD